MFTGERENITGICSIFSDMWRGDEFVVLAYIFEREYHLELQYEFESHCFHWCCNLTAEL